MPLSVGVTSTKLSNDTHPHTLFVVSVKNDTKSWTVGHRFNDFSLLRDKLIEIEKALPKLPSKTLLKAKNAEMIKERMLALNQWLQDVNRMERVNNHPALLQFLDVDGNSGSSGAISVEETSLDEILNVLIVQPPQETVQAVEETKATSSPPPPPAVAGGGVVRIRLDPSLNLPSSHISLMYLKQTAAEWKNETIRKLNIKYKSQLDEKNCFLVDSSSRPIADGCILTLAELGALTIMHLDRLATPPTKAGVLLKLAKTGARSWRTWDKRHFILTSGELSYYTDATLCTLKGIIVLSKAQVTLPQPEKYGKDFTIEIKRADCDKMYVLLASTRLECQQWFDCIQKETDTQRKVILEGFLGRPEGDPRATATQRWVVLVPDALHYYKHKGDTKITGSINLSQGAKVTIDPKAKWSFAVCPNNSLKTFVLTASSDSEMHTWVNAIKKAIVDQSTLDPVLDFASSQERRRSSLNVTPWLREEQRNPFTIATLSNLWNACDRDQDGLLTPSEIDDFLAAWVATNGNTVNLERTKAAFWVQFAAKVGQSLSKDEVLGNTRQSMSVRQPSKKAFATGAGSISEKAKKFGTLLQQQPQHAPPPKPKSPPPAENLKGANLISELKKEGSNNVELMNKFETMCEDGAPEGFLSGGGLDALSAILAKVKHSRKGWQEAKHSGKDCDLPQLSALKALKSIVVSEAIMTQVMGSIKLVDNIALCCLSSNPRVQMAALEMLTVMVTIHDRGTELALAALANVKQIARTINHMEAVVLLLLQPPSSENLQLLLTGLIFLNELVNSFEGVDARVLIRKELFDANLQAVLQPLREWAVTELTELGELKATAYEECLESTIHQVETFETEYGKDQAKMMYEGLDLSNSDVVFKYIKQMSEELGYAPELSVVLKSLAMFPRQRNKAKRAWGIVAKLLSQLLTSQSETGDLNMTELQKSLTQISDTTPEEDGYVPATLPPSALMSPDLDLPPPAPPLFDDVPPPPGAPDAPPDAPGAPDAPDAPPGPPGPPGAPGAPGFGTSSPGFVKFDNNLRKLHWTPMTTAEGIWEDVVRIKIDEAEVSRVFAVPKKAKGEKGEGSVTKKEEPKETVEKEIRLVDPKRAYGVEIALSRFRMGSNYLSGDDEFAPLKRAILSMDDGFLTTDRLIALLSIAPTTEEIEQVKAYQGPLNRLGTCEQFFLSVSPIFHLTNRLEVTVFRATFDIDFANLTSQLQDLEGGLHCLKSAPLFKRVLGLVLQLGNHLNAGTAKGNAKAFKLDVLTKLDGTKSTDQKSNLLAYLVDYIALNCPEVLDFTHELQPCKAATRVSLPPVREHINKLVKHSALLQQEMKEHRERKQANTDDRFYKVMENFEGGNTPAVARLSSRLSACEGSLTEIPKYFGVEDSMDAAAVLETVDAFADSFSQRVEERAKQAQIKERDRQKQQQQELAAAIKAQQAQAKTSKRAGEFAEQASSEHQRKPTMADAVMVNLRASKVTTKRKPNYRPATVIRE